jgi:hypothetical protein
MASQRSLIAALAAGLSGYAFIRHSRSMLHNGIGGAEGGGWTAVIMTEAMVCFMAVAFALAST